MQVSKEQIEALAGQCHRSPVEFARVFFPHWFPRKMPWFHRGILAMWRKRADFLLDFGVEEWDLETAAWTPEDLEKILTNFLEEGTGNPIFTLTIDEEGNPKIDVDVKDFTCVVCPRGTSKTTLFNLDNAYECVYQEEDFFLYISETGGHASRQLVTVRDELADNDGVPTNEMLNTVFGNFKPGRQDSRKWTEEFIETLKGSMFGALGTGGQVRGFGKNAKRPGKIGFDDLQDEEAVASDTQLVKDSHWFFNAALPALKMHGGRAHVLGTLLHPTSGIINKCIKSSRFTTVRFGAIDRQGEALWPFWRDLVQLEEMRLQAIEDGELRGFYLEYHSSVFDDSTSAFPESKLIYVHKGMECFAALAEAMDPAISAERSADMCAYAVVGIEHTGHKHVLESYGKVGMEPDEQIEKFFELHFKWFQGFPPELQKHGIEAIAYQRALIPMVRMKQIEYSGPHKLSNGTTHIGWGTLAYFEVTPIHHGKIGKVTRVKGILKPLIWGGHISFEERYPAMADQLVNWSDAKGHGRKDLPDVASMAVALLDPYVTLGLGEEGVKDLEKDTMEPLPSDWRRAP